MMNVIKFKGINIIGFESADMTKFPYLMTTVDSCGIFNITKEFNLCIKGYETEGYYNGREIIEISLEELIEIINSIENRETGNEIINECDEIIEDCKIIQKGFKDIGIKLSLRECYVIHNNYSNAKCASWIGIGNKAHIEEEIYFVLTGIIEAIDYDFYI